MPKETWRWLILTCILVPFLLVHLFFAVDRDGGTFLTIAQGLLDGRLPYRDFFDHKPPGIYYALSVPLALSKGSIWAAKVFLLLVAMSTLGLVAWALRALGTDYGAIWWSIAFGALGWVVYQGYTLVTETLMACMVAGALIPLISDKPRVGLAGFLIGLATLFKQPALLFLIPLLVYTLIVRPMWALWKVVIGFAAALFIGGSLLIALGIGRNAWEQVVLANLLAPPIGELREVIAAAFSHMALFQQIQAGWTLANLSDPDEPILVLCQG